MSYTAEDKLKDKRLTVVYGVSPLSLSTSGGRWERSREIRRHLSRTRSRSVLVTRTADGLEESWWAARGAERGVSFAAAVDQWLNARISDDGAAPLPGILHVVIPLDGMIYFAHVEAGIVTDEAVLAPEPARERLAEIAGAPIYAFNGGLCTGPVEEHVELEDPDPPFDLAGFRYGSPAAAMLRNGLFHPMHAVSAFLAIALVIACMSLFHHLSTDVPFLRDWLHPELAEAVQPQPVRIEIPEVSWSAHVDLMQLAMMVVNAEPLHADGLTEVRYQPSSTILAGTLPGGGWPARVPVVADALGGEWSMDSNGWRILAPAFPATRPARKTVRGEPVLRSLLQHPLRMRITGGPSRHVPPQPGGSIRLMATRKTHFQASLSGITAHDLVEAADTLRDLPVRLSSAICTFAQWRITGCTLHFESQTL